MEPFEQLLRETEARYEERSDERLATQEKLETGRVLDADSPERVEKRLARLQIDRPAAEVMLNRRYAFGPIPTPGGLMEEDPIVLERILGTSDLMSICFLERGVLVSRAVGRMKVRTSSGRAALGTGFLVSPRLAMTNNHVIGSRQEAGRSQLEFNYQMGLSGHQLAPVVFRLAPDDFFLTNPRLDYTVVAVRPQSQDGQPLADFGWNRLIEEEGKIIKGERLNIIQHPNGEMKQLALRANQLIDVLEEFLHYRTDTSPGSSGAPALNDQWEVVALHHSGVPRRNDEDQILTRDGTVWRSVMGEYCIDWIANEGARISRIVRHVQTQSLTPSERRLRAEMFEAEPPGALTGLQSVSAMGGGPKAHGAQLESEASPTPGAYGVTWTVPLQITVRVGAAAMPTAVAGAALDVYRPQAGPVAGIGGELPDDSELREAMEEVEKYRDRPYYDAKQDKKDRKAYYGEVEESENPDEMFERLSKLIRGTHKDRPKYRPSKHVYPWVDLHADRKLRSIYSGRAFDPEELIREDFRIGQERAIRMREIVARESLSDGQIEEEIDLLEAHLPYNCEHVVPQSWFDKREPMRGDLHHLFACEWGCNSFRGNRAYFDFPDFEEAMRDLCGKLLDNRFEPVANKGPVARATLYFLLRYPGDIDDDSGEFDVDRLDMLLGWHERFPVNDYERHRNAAIFEKQGNRNPLIDFPEWAERIDFTLGFD